MRNFCLWLAAWVSYSMALAQGEANNWYFGNTAGITFNGGTPTALTNGVLSTLEGCATISDKNGNLIFYTDGRFVYNRNHIQMPNGSGLFGDQSAAQSAIIVPRPGNANRYYIFTVAAAGGANGFCYSEVDMTLNGGLGDVIAATKNTQLFTPSAEKLTAVKHANGLYVWVLGHSLGTSTYYAYLVDCNGVNAPVSSAVGTNEAAPGWGYLVASPDGSKLGSALRVSGFELLDFNNATGQVSNPLLLNANGGNCYGVCFSPDNSLLYTLNIGGSGIGQIFQWNTLAGSQAAIIASGTLIGTAAGTASPYRGGALQLGPDGKLYVCQYNQPYLSVINNPNTIGTGCNLQLNAVDLLGRNCVLGLPPFIQSYFDTTAVINYTPTCQGQTASFSINAATAFLDSVKWNFDDPGSGAANTSTTLSPTHIFNNAGTYNVQLIRYINCISDTAYIAAIVKANSSSSASVYICPGGAYTRPGGSVATAAGTYYDTIPATNGCDSIITTTVNVASVNVDAGNNTSLCKGQSTQLNATGGLIYTWSPATGLSSNSIANPVATPTVTTTYTVTTQVPLNNLITNGDFSAGNTSFSSSYAYTPPPNTSEGQYWVSTSAQAWNGGMSPCGDHTTGSGNMLIVNGATSTNVSIYCQTVNVLPNTDYAFSTWLQTVTAGNPAQLQFSVNGSNLGSVFTASTSTCIWQQFYTVWNSGSNTTATICIVNQNTQAGANDFTLDDISFAQLCTGIDSVTITVYPTDTTIVNTTICQGQQYTLPNGSVVNTTGTYNNVLPSVHNCDSLIITNLTVYPSYSFTVSQTICPSDVYTLPDGSVVNTSGTYIDTLTTVNGCDSIITTQLTVVSPNITVSNDTSLCLGSSAQLNASGGLFTYSWSPAAGLSDSSIANPVATPLQTTTYVVTTQVASGDLIANGNFSGGNAGFSSSYGYSSDLTPEGVYYVGANPNTYHSGFTACPDHTTGTGNMMIVNGSGTPGTSVWCETINVVPNTNYAFSCWGQSVAPGSPAVLQFSINGSLLSAPFTVPYNTCIWQQFYAIWNSGSNTTANICIINQNTSTSGNDFALDDISFIGLCVATDTVTITVNNPVTTTIDTTICQGTTYTFPLGNTATTSTTDTALLADQHGCDSTVITRLVVNPSPVVDVYDTICQGNNYTRPSGAIATATGIYNDTLATTLGCDSVIITHLTVNPTSATTVNDTICYGSIYTLPDGNTVTNSGNYPITLTNQYGCDSIVTTVLVVIKDTLAATPTPVLCNGSNTGSINSTATKGLSPYTYNLVLGGNNINSNTTGTFTNLTAGNYTINVTDNFGCTATTTALVTEPTALQVSDTVINVTCYNAGDGQVIISANGGTAGYTYNLNNSNNSTGIFSQLNAGNYPYTVTDANGCTDTASATVTQPQQIIINLNPTAVDVKLGEGAQILATTNYDPTANYLWNPPIGLNCITCPNPQVMVYNTTTYQLEVSVDVNGNICYANTELNVIVTPDYSLFVPNAFTPNGDGVNDVFQVFGNMQAVKFVEAEIFNRIGEKVFSSNDLNFTWDGNYKGQLAPPGVYVYQLKVVFVDNYTEKLLKGTLTLLR